MNEVSIGKEPGRMPAGLFLVGVFVLFEIALVFHISATRTASELVVLILILLFALFVFCRTVSYVSGFNRGAGASLSSRLLLTTVLLLVSFGVASVLEALTVFGSPAGHALNISDWNFRRLIYFWLMAYASLFFFGKKAVTGVEEKFGSGVQLGTGFRGPVFVVAVCVALFSISFAYGFGTINPLGYLVLVMLIASLCFAAWCGRIIKNVSLVVFVCSLCFGAFIVMACPVTTGLSWDDQIHYKNALQLSYLFESQMTDTDVEFSEEAVRRAQGEDPVGIVSISSEEVREHAAQLDASYSHDVANGRVAVDKSSEPILTLSSIGYTPHAIGFWVGRLLHLSFSQMVVLSKVCGVLFYSTIVAAAVYVSPSKKALFAVVGLLPTSVFLAANYSYDSWLISLVMLGFAYYLRYAWGNPVDFCRRNVVKSLVCLGLGLAVKAVYFPVLGLLLFVRRDRFETSLQRRAYYLAVIVVGLTLIISFVAPFLFTISSSDAVVGDTRGGSGVDSSGQVSFILHNPAQYASILLNFFLFTYFLPTASAGYTVTYAYLTSTTLSGSLNLMFTVPLICLLLVAVLSEPISLSGSLNCKKRTLAFAWSFVLFVVTFVLVATALYVSFTPVGLDTVNGCQMRYILPALVPFLATMLNVRIPKTVSVRKLLCVTLLLAVVLNSACSYFSIVCRYI